MNVESKNIDQPGMLELYTERLLLRDFVEDDWKTIYAMSQTPLVTDYQPWLRLTEETEAHQWIQRAVQHNQLQPRQAYNLAIVQVDPRYVIGWLGWGPPNDDVRGDYDFGYALLPDAWGQGYMTEALKAALDYMFASLNASLVTGECVKSNQASARVMKKVGMKLVDQWEEIDSNTSTTETHTQYALQREQWLQNQQTQSRL